MFSDAGSRLPWKSFHANTCRSVVRSLPRASAHDTVTLADNELAPAIVVASAVPTARAIGAPSTTATDPAIRPPLIHRERSRGAHRERGSDRKRAGRNCTAPPTKRGSSFVTAHSCTFAGQAV